MKIRTKFILFITVIHSITVSMSFWIFKQDKIYFIVSELIIILSLWIAWQLYQDLIQPISLLMTGVEAIKDRDFNVKFLQTGKYEMDKLIAVYNQMIDQLRQEKTQQEEQHYFLKKLVQTSPTGILMLDLDERIADINPKACELIGLPQNELIGLPVSSIDHPIFQGIKLLNTGDSQMISLNGVQTFKCQKSHFIDRGFPRYFVMIEELSAEILAAEKKAYGKVIRMMAHEVNNSIGAVNSILDSSMGMVADPEIATVMQIAIERNNHLNYFMRRFADVVRLPLPQLQEINVNQLVNTVSKLLEFMAKAHEVNFRFELSEKPILIMADLNQIEQVLINITKNSIEAIGNQGTVTFETTAHPTQLRVIDTGKGVQLNQAEDLFSPFFTTKKEGQGIGLTLVREILMNHHFTFSLQTVAPQQTVFSIVF